MSLPAGVSCDASNNSFTAILRATLPSDATATFFGSPSLALAYNSVRQESSLTATYNIIVSGGTNGINIYQNGAWSTFVDQTGAGYSTNSETTVTTAVTPTTTITDSNGQTLFVVPAHKSLMFRVVSTINPQQLFAGTYSASLQQSLLAVVGTNANNAFKLSLPNNISNSVTIVGEVAPYITSVTTPVAPGAILVITGLRLNGTSGSSIVYIDNAPVSSATSFSQNGTIAKVIVPASFVLASGHSLFITNSVTGQSNTIGFQVSGGPSITSVSPTSALPGSMVIVHGTSLSSEVTNMVEICGSASCGNYNGTVSVDGTTVTFVVPNIPAGSYNLVIIDTIANGNGSTSAVPFTVTTSSTTTQPSMTLTSSPTLTLAYNSSQKESALTATVSFSVNGGTQGVNIYSNSAAVNFLDQNGNASGQIVSASLQPTSPVVTATDMYGEKYYTVPPGQSVSFQDITTANPQQMFAGTYHASLVSVLANPGTNLSNEYVLSAPSNQSGTITIIGELSPYITSVTNPISAGQVFTINGQRLSGTVLIDGSAPTPLTVSGPVNANGQPNTILTFTFPASISAGTHTVSVSNPTTGLSNQVGFQVVTSPTNLPPVINGGTFPTSLTVGQTGTWVVNASDPQNGSLSYSVNWGDTSTCPTGFICEQATTAKAAAFVQSSSFTHAYAAAGTYTVTFTVQNSAGLTAQTSTTVTVTQAVVTPVVGSVTASLDAASPLSGIIQTNQSGVTLAVIDLKAGGTAVTNLSGIQIASDSTNAGTLLQNIKVYAGSTLLATAAPLLFNGSYYYQWILNISGLVLPANTVVPIRLVADISSPSANNSIRLGIAGLNFSAPGAVTTGLPLYGATMSLSSGTGYLSNLSLSIDAPQTTNIGLLNTTTFSGSFTVTAGQVPVQIAKISSAALTAVTNSTNISATVSNFVPTNGIQVYDGTNYYQIIPGTSRTFIVNGSITNNSTGQIMGGVGISAVYLNTNINLSQPIPITTNLQGLNSDFHIQVLLGAGTPPSSGGGGGSSASYTSHAILPVSSGTANVWDAITSWIVSLFQ
jgi:hypothetical protein